jgi:SpoVK/Ycf46/Vps4 family AAA+-type ATPase
MDGWGKIKPASKYAGVCERKMRDFLHQGLKYSRLPSGTVLIKFSHIDEFLGKFQTNEDQVENTVAEVLRDIQK